VLWTCGEHEKDRPVSEEDRFGGGNPIITQQTEQLGEAQSTGGHCARAELR